MSQTIKSSQPWERPADYVRTILIPVLLPFYFDYV